jgi:heat shock protein HtpX
MNNLKTAFWMALLTVLLVLAGRLVAGTAGMIVALGLAVALNGVAYWFSDRLALTLGGARPVTASEYPLLHQMADSLAAVYRVPKPAVYVSDDAAANAFATGRSPKHASICVTKGLLRLVGREELFAVLAHEFGHVRNRDILISSVVAVLAGAVTLLANFAQWSLWFGGGDREGRGGSPFGVLGLLLVALLAPLAATLVQLAISRSREYEADRTGAEVSGSPLALARALMKLEAARPLGGGREVSPAFAHLYIVNPLDGGLLAGLFSTHPPVPERIRRLEAMARP